MKKRKIVKRPEYELAVKDMINTFQLPQDLFWGAEWSLARTPEKDGIYNQELGVWQATIVGDRQIDMPPLRILYMFDEYEVRLLTVLPRKS